MKTRRADILQRAAELVAEAEGVTVWRSRVDPVRVEQEGATAIVMPVSDVVVEENLAFLDRLLTFQVDVYMRGSVPDDAGDKLAAEAYEAIMTDKILADKAIDLSPGNIGFQMWDADGKIGVTSLQFSCRYRTERTKLTRMEISA